MVVMIHGLISSKFKVGHSKYVINDRALRHTIYGISIELDSEDETPVARIIPGRGTDGGAKCGLPGAQ